MTVVLGTPTPSRLGVAANTDASFPDTPGTWTSPDGAIVIPGGALDRWWAYRATRGAVRRDFPIFGDSTWYGSNDYGEGNKSVQQWLRTDATAWGMADAGKGLFGAGEASITYDSPEINGYIGQTFSGSGDSFDLLAGQFWTSVNGAETLTLQFKGTTFRLWFTKRVLNGEFTYTVDGGGATTVNAWAASSQANAFVYVSGLSNTTHTIVITNRGGRTALPPGTPSGGLGAPASGTFSAGDYYYVVTNVFGGGETLASPEVKITDDGSVGGRNHTASVADIGQASCKLYRGTVAGGPYGQMSLSPTTGGGLKIFGDDGSTSPNMGVNPPVSGTTNLNTSSPRAIVAFAGMNDTGLSLQKVATNGGTMQTFMSGTAKPWSAFGLAYDGVSSLTSAASYSVDVSITSGRPNPVCAMLDLGFNDMVDSTTVAQLTTGVNMFAAMCQAASCDGIVCSGNLPYKAAWPTYGAAHFNALKTAAAANGLAFVDLFFPVDGPSLSYVGGTQSPHLHLAKYQAQADYFWNSLLGMNQ